MKSKIFIIIPLLLFIISCNTTGKKDSDTQQRVINKTDTHPNSSNYQKIIDDYMAAGNVGMSITVISPEGTWSKTAGMADLKNDKKMLPSDLFRIASISKVYTAVTVMKLYELGEIKMNDKMSKYLPEEIANNIANGDIITIKQLLNHTSGIKNYINITHSGWLDNTIKKLPAEENIKYIYKTDANFEPGTSFAYSNSNYLLLGMIIKKITGESSVYKAITDILITPYGYSNTLLTKEPVAIVKGYKDASGSGEMKDFSYVEENAVGGQDMVDGGMISNSYDVATFFNDLMNGKILSDSTMEMMQTWVNPNFPEIEKSVRFVGYGLGLLKIKTENKTAIGHYGSITCFNSLVFYFSDINTTVCILNNSSSTNIAHVHMSNKIFKYLYH